MGGPALAKVAHVSCSICTDAYCVDEDRTHSNCVTVPARAQGWACPTCRDDADRNLLTEAEAACCQSDMNVSASIFC